MDFSHLEDAGMILVHTVWAWRSKSCEITPVQDWSNRTVAVSGLASVWCAARLGCASPFGFPQPLLEDVMLEQWLFKPLWTKQWFKELISPNLLDCCHRGFRSSAVVGYWKLSLLFHWELEKLPWKTEITNWINWSAGESFLVVLDERF